MKTILSRLSILALAALLAASVSACGASRDDKSAEPEAAASDAVSVETGVAADNAEAALPAEDAPDGKIDMRAVYAAYKKEVDSVYAQNANTEIEHGDTGRNAETTAFYLYDFNADGIPELMLDHGYKTNTMDEGVAIYTFSSEKGLIRLGSTDPLATFFTDETLGDGEFGLYCFYHDRTAEYKYRIVGETLIETVVEDWRDAVVTGDSSEYEETEARVKPILIVEPDGWYAASDADAVFAGF